MKDKLLYSFILASSFGLLPAPSGLPGAKSSNTNSAEIKVIISVADGIIGALSILTITISGLFYVTSDGDPQKLARARNGIIYSLVGIAVAISAQAIVTYVVSNV